MKISLFYDNIPAEEFQAAVGSLNCFPVMPPEKTAVAKIRFSVPMVDIHSLWHSNMSELQVRLRWTLDYTCAVNWGMPYVAMLNSARQQRCAVSTDNLIDDTRFVCAVNQQNCTYDVTVEVTCPEQPEKFQFFVDLRTGMDFQLPLAEWREKVKSPGLKFPDGAWEPVFCTWYAVHGAVTARWIEQNAAKMKELGFKTLIVDDGWCYDESKRVTPETLPDWYNTIGSWKISEKKFPDFKDHVRKLQQQGLKYLLWVAPHFAGKDTDIFKEHREWFFDKVHEGCSHLKTANTEAVDFIAARLSGLAQDNLLDGLKIDFIDIVRPDINAPVGRTTLRLIRALAEGVRSKNPDNLIEFRQGYATVSMLPYATQFRAGDVPFDWHLNFRRLVDIRLCIGDNVPVHADPAYWGAEEIPVNVARHMIAMLAGVPMLSMDLNAIPEYQQDIIRYHIAVYNNCRELLNHGHWQMVFSAGETGAAIVENENCRLVILNDAGVLNKVTSTGGKKLILFNIAAEAVDLPGAQVYDWYGKAVAGQTIPPGYSGTVG